jgi:hypothetical protein
MQLPREKARLKKSTLEQENPGLGRYTLGHPIVSFMGEHD